jgi:uncharacterized protein
VLSNIKEITIILRINYTNENLNNNIINQINSIIDLENRDRITISMRKVWQEKIDRNRSSLISNILKQFEDAGYFINYYTDIISNFVPCYASRKYYNAISYDGKVIKCTANNDMYSDNPPGHLNADGTITWRDNDESKFYRRLFENKQCTSCKYLPMCMGECPRDCNVNIECLSCKMNRNDRNWDDIIIDIIENSRA